MGINKCCERRSWISWMQDLSHSKNRNNYPPKRQDGNTDLKLSNGWVLPDLKNAKFSTRRRQALIDIVAF